MTPAIYNFVIREGQTFRRTLVWKDSSGKPMNLTGCVVLVQFRDKPDGVLLQELNVGNGALTVTPLKGSVAMYLSDEETAALTYAKASWDMRVTFTNGESYYPIGGKVQVTRSVTE
jgi:hypothetical protein